MPYRHESWGWCTQYIVTSYQHDEEYEYQYGESLNQQPNGAELPLQPVHQSRTWYPPRPATLTLSLLLALVTVLAIVAASVAGSLAAKRSHSYVLLLDNRDCFRTDPSYQNISCAVSHLSANPTDLQFFMPSSQLYNSSYQPYRSATLERLCQARLEIRVYIHSSSIQDSLWDQPLRSRHARNLCLLLRGLLGSMCKFQSLLERVYMLWSHLWSCWLNS